MKHIVQARDLQLFCQEIFERLGMSEQDAGVSAKSLVEADLRGVESHGVSRMAIYSQRLEKGVVNPRAEIKVLREYPATLSLDANNGPGIAMSARAMEKTIRKARESGSCFTSLRHSNHNGMASFYTEMASRQGMIGISGTNAPPNIAPTGSSQPYLGTNPISLSAPRLGEPVTLDMAASVVAMGKVILAAKNGQAIPLGWALTAQGEPTTDAKLGSQGSVIPIGGPKGYGIAFFIEALCGVLTGTLFGPHLNNLYHDFENPQQVSHFFCAIRLDTFCETEAFRENMERMIQEIKSLPRKEGVSEIFVPGEIELGRKAQRLRKGIPLSAAVYEELQSLGAKLGTKMPLTSLTQAT